MRCGYHGGHTREFVLIMRVYNDECFLMMLLARDCLMRLRCQLDLCLSSMLCNRFRHSIT